MVDIWSAISPQASGIVFRRACASLCDSNLKCLSKPLFFVTASGQFVRPFDMNALSAFLLEMRFIRIAFTQVAQNAASFYGL